MRWLRPALWVGPAVLTGAVECTAGDLGQLAVYREYRHHGDQLGEVPVLIEGRQVVQQLQGSHQGLWGWRRQNGRSEPLMGFQAQGQKSDERWNNLHNCLLAIMAKLWNNLDSFQTPGSSLICAVFTINRKKRSY